MSPKTPSREVHLRRALDDIAGLVTHCSFVKPQSVLLTLWTRIRMFNQPGTYIIVGYNTVWFIYIYSIVCMYVCNCMYVYIYISSHDAPL